MRNTENYRVQTGKKSELIYAIAVCIMLWSVFVSFSDSRKSIDAFESGTFGRNSLYLDSAGLDSFITVVMAQNHIPGVSACIVKRGRIIWTGNYGWAYINPPVPVYDSTLFHVASVSKTVTGAALMRLYQWGLFGLDDSINAYLPFKVRNPTYPDSVITFRMLLLHKSSIRDNWQKMPYFYNINTAPPCSLGDYLEDYLSPDSIYFSPLNFYYEHPDSAYHYSNIGYALIGYLAERISGIDFNQYCKDSIFARLGVYESSFYYSDIDTMHKAMPYKYENSNYVPYGHYMYYAYPYGMLKTSTVQMSRFLIAFMQYGRYGNQRILDSATVRLILTPVLIIPNSGELGLTWGKIILNNRIIWGHGGVEPGVRTMMFFCPNDTTGALLFTNGENIPGCETILNEMFNYASDYVVSVNPLSSKIQADYKLHQNYPNPFNPSTKIKFEIPSWEGYGFSRGVDLVTLKVYDIAGREVAILINEKLQPGTYEITFDGSYLSSGIYFYQFITKDFSETKKLILLN